MLVFGLMTQRTFAQCSAATSATISYDTVVTGTGNSEYTFTFPKFDASMGTLLDVTISSTVNLTYDFRLENLENVRINTYEVRLVRDEEISGISLGTPIDNSFQKTYGSYSLGATTGFRVQGRIT